MTPPLDFSSLEPSDVLKSRKLSLAELRNDLPSSNVSVAFNRTFARPNTTTIKEDNATMALVEKIRDHGLHESAAMLQDGSIFTSESSPGHALSADHFSSYPTTLLFLAIAHVLFLHHWNRRRTRKQIYSSYDTLVQKKQCYRAWLALLSHPARVSTRTAASLSRNRPRGSASYYSPIVAMGNAEDGTYHRYNGDIIWRFRAQELALTIGLALTRGSWSGWPLLFYNSHILWSCRALEGDYGSSCYSRVLIALATIALVLELDVCRRLLQLARRLDEVPWEDEPDIRPWLRGVISTLKYRHIGGLTSTASAVAIVFHNRFPMVPLQLVPCLHNFSFFLNPYRTLFITMGILLFLGNATRSSSNPKERLFYLPLVCGLVSGSIWSLGWTDFLAEAYWGNAGLLLLAALSILTAKSDPAISLWVVCVDFVAWDHQGRMPVPGADAFREADDSSEEDGSDGEDSTHDSSLDEAARAFPDPEDSEIFGLLPALDDMDDEEGGDLELALSVRSSQARVRARHSGRHG